MTIPLNVLDKALGRRILLILKDGRRLEGKLTSYDEFMNLVLEATKETIELESATTTTATTTSIPTENNRSGDSDTAESGSEPTKKVQQVRKLGVVIVRGNNILSITLR